mgnify:CR=1 FL=1|tara:strand:+ start:1020 stop:2585 length:1566 start_codon:yes stop_codon:yes gene_type:complete
MGVKKNMMKSIKRALISVSDKNKLNFLIKNLQKYNIEIISTGGTFKKIKKSGFKCTEISEYTNSPEILNGRVKTLHPKIHGGILSERKNSQHIKDLKKMSIKEIDLIVVNFYPFEEIINNTKNEKKIIENIDIGGPTLARAAAKNFENVTIIPSINYYKELVEELKKYNGYTSINFRKKMSTEAFLETAYYESMISNYFLGKYNNYFPFKKTIGLKKVDILRYGENPHQKAALYSIGGNKLNLNQLSGKKLSYNNINDIYSSLLISKSLPKNRGTVIVKHANPCGVSIERDNLKSYQLALGCDPISAFGGVISFNFKVNKNLASELNKIFLEVIVANGFDKQAINILKKRKNLRLIDSSKLNFNEVYNFISKFNSILIQSSDIKKLSKRDFVVASKIRPNKETFESLMFAFNVCRHVNSNAIVLAAGNSTVGIGSGQPSRIDSCEIAIKKMNKFQRLSDKQEICAASDAFFPFVDGIEKLVQSGVSAVIQPSGSVRDKEIIKFANKAGIVLIFSKTRHFKH